MSQWIELFLTGYHWLSDTALKGNYLRKYDYFPMGLCLRLLPHHMTVASVVSLLNHCKFMTLSCSFVYNTVKEF